MDTFELLPSLAQGELSDTSAPELVAAVFRSRASGTLSLETHEGAEIRVFFRAGDMCGTGGFAGFQTLAHVLLVNEWVNALDIDASRSEAELQRKRHGEILVAQGLLTPEQLRAALAEQHRRNLAAVLALTGGKYEWRGWEPPPAWAREVVVDPVGCIVDALETDLAAPRRQRVLEWLGGSAARLSVDWVELQGRIALQPSDRRAAALLALPRRLGEFVQAARMPQPRAEALLTALLLAGAVEPQPAAAHPPALDESPLEPAAFEGPAEPTFEPLPLDASTELLPLQADELAAGHESQEPLQEVLEPFPATALEEALEASSPDLLPEPLPESALEPEAPPFRPGAPVTEQEAFARLDLLSPADLRTATNPGHRLQSSAHDEIDLSADEPLQLEREPGRAGHLDGSSDEPLPGLESPALQPDDARGKEMRMKLLHRGLRNLGSMPGARDEPARAAPPLDAVAEPLPAAGEVDAASLSADERKFVDEVRARLRAPQGQGAYARLGLTAQATSEQIKAAYIQAAKRFHPDRASASPALAPLQAELQTLFSWTKEAYDLVATPDARARYDASVRSAAEASRPASRKEEAALALKMGDALLKKRDFEAAIAKLRRAVELDPNGDALAALAWGLVCDPKQAAAAKEEAASLVSRALRAPGPTARTYYVAGVIWRTKDPDSAVDAFRKALELDSNHPDASLELRLLESRRGKSSKPGGVGVLSGLLFGKRK